MVITRLTQNLEWILLERILQHSGQMSGYSSVVERRTPEPKVSGSSPDRIGGRVFFYSVNLQY